MIQRISFPNYQIFCRPILSSCHKTIIMDQFVDFADLRVLLSAKIFLIWAGLNLSHRQKRMPLKMNICSINLERCVVVAAAMLLLLLLLLDYVLLSLLLLFQGLTEHLKLGGCNT